MHRQPSRLQSAVVHTPATGGKRPMPLSLESTMRVVFTIYAAFWAVVIVGLFFATGVFLRRR